MQKSQLLFEVQDNICHDRIVTRFQQITNNLA